MANIIVDDDILRRIKSRVGFPMLDEAILDDEEIKIYAIAPALEEYFRWFPIQERYHQNVNNSFSVPFPDDFTFGAMDTRVINSTPSGINSITGNRMLDIVTVNRYNRAYSYYSRNNRQFTNTGITRAFENERQLRNVTMAKTDVSRVIVNHDERVVTGYTTESATLHVIWAKYSHTFSSVRFERKEEVIKLCQSYLLQHLSDATGLFTNNNVDVDFDSSKLQSNAEDLREEVLKDWREFTKVIALPKQTGLVW